MAYKKYMTPAEAAKALAQQAEKEKRAAAGTTPAQPASFYSNKVNGASAGSNGSGTRTTADPITIVPQRFRTKETQKAEANPFGPRKNSYELQQIRTKKYGGKSYKEIQETLGLLEDGEEKDWVLQNMGSIYQSDPKFKDYVGMGETMYRLNKAKKQTDEADSWWMNWLTDGSGASDVTGLGTVAAAQQVYAEDTSWKEPTESWSDEERNLYWYLYANDPTAADNFGAAVTEVYNAQANAQAVGKAKGWASEHPVLGTAASVAAAPLSMVDVMKAVTDYGVRGRITTTPELLPGQFSSAATERISMDLNKYGTLDESLPVIGGKGLGDAYQIGVSILQSLTYGHGLGRAGTGATFFGSSFSSSMYDALDRGASDEQAILLGLAHGLAESAGETFSVDRLLKNDVPADSLGNFFKIVLKQAGVEASEEGTTSIMQNLADYLVMKDKSNYTVMMDMYMQGGMSEEEAKKQTWKNLVNDFAFDMLAGAVSGGFSGGVQTGVRGAMDVAAANKQVRTAYASEPMALVEEALAIDPDNKLAQKMKAKLDNGEAVSTNQLRKLIDRNDKALVEQDIETIGEAAAQRLAELGEQGDTEVIGRAIAKETAGEKLSRKERKALEDSKYGQRVINELDAENIRNDAVSSDWTGNLNTQIINTEEYSRLAEQAEELTQEQTEEAAEEALDAEDAVETEEAEETEEADAIAAMREALGVTAEEETVDARTETVDAGTKTVDQSTVRQTEATQEAPAEPVTLQDYAKRYGPQAGAMEHTYLPNQNVESYAEAFDRAFEMGKAGVRFDYVKGSSAVSYLTDSQRQIAYDIGKAAASTAADARQAEITAGANGKSGRRKGTVRGDGVSISDLRKTFNDTQNTAYKLLVGYAEVTGVDIVLYRSQVGSDGRFIGAQGKYSKREPGTLYIDLNAGLSNIRNATDLAQYAMMRTFAHEFTHFIENWSPVEYNGFRSVVFDELTVRGENADDLITLKMEQNPGMSYDDASREVVAEAMTDILPDAHFAEALAQQHKTVFDKLVEKLREFVGKIKEYYRSIGANPSREANALKEQVGEAVQYAETIVELFDRVAIQAVENYQSNYAVEEVEQKIETRSATAQENAASAERVEEIPTENQHFSISENEKHGSLEIKFTEKPPAAVRDAMKDKGFRWHKKKGVWYGTADRSELTALLNEAYDREGAPLETAQQATSDEKQATSDEKQAVSEETTTVAEEKKPAASADSIYERLKNPLSFQNHFEIGGYRFAVEKLSDNNYVGTIKRHSDEYVSNARGLNYRSDVYERRDDAVQNIVDVARNNALLEAVETKTAPVVETVGETTIKEEYDEQGTETQHRSDGQGTARLLEDVETEAVQGTGTERDTVADSGERRDEAGRHDHRPDAAGDERGHGEGSSQSGNLRRTDGVNSHEAAKQYAADKGYRIAINKLAAKKQIVQVDIYDKSDLPTSNPVIINEASDWNKVKEAIDSHEEAEKAKAAKLKSIVVDLTEQQSTELPKGRNFVIGDSLDLPKGDKARYKANVDAIRLVKRLEAESRYATPSEQQVLSKYVGWGGLSAVFDKNKQGWSSEYAELKELLTDEEYKAARGSTLNAHYTDISVIKAMYDGLKHLGFQGGRLLEPSAGVGNFVGAMPADMTNQVKSWTMVELDSITGKIAKYLYPNADVRIQGFENANIPNNFMDVAISNVPFGNYEIRDKAYPKKVTGAIHNYFFAKSLDKVRPGGIVMFITSSYTMNSSNTAVREYIMGRADLLGAIRLPNTAFKGNAGTEVVTDILVLKKRAPGTAYAGENFLEAPYTKPVQSSRNGAYVNEYFNAHPEMVLGTPSFGGMYRGDSLTYKPLEGRGTLGDQIREAFSHMQGKMDYTVQPAPEKLNFAVERATKKVKNNGLVVKDGKVYENDDGVLVEKSSNAGTVKRVSGMLAIRDANRALQNALLQGQNENAVKKARKELNKAYDGFVNEFGYLNLPANRKALADDPDKFSLFALENYNPETKTATKADVFTRNTLAANRTETFAEDVPSGLIISMNRKGGVDVPFIAQLTGKTEAEVTRQLIGSGLAYKTVNGGLEAAEVYLSGNVRAKLRDAEAMAPFDKDFQKNVDALREVMPKDIAYHDIYVTPGSPWIPANVYADFAAYMLGTVNSDWRQAVDVSHNKETGNFVIELKEQRLKHHFNNTQKWGTERRSFLELLNAMMNSKSVVVKDKIGDTSVINKDATAAANEKIEEITKEFQSWLWRDENRRTELTTLYNEVFNSLVTPKYNGDNLTVDGANPEKSLRPHQRDAVQRIVSSGGNTLLAHKVGAGKTYEMAAGAMKLKQLGIINKPMFAVPKSLVAQWGKEFLDFFPAARLLVAEPTDFTSTNRKIFANRIANGDYDAVIVSYEQFEKLPISNDFAKSLYEEQIESVIAAIEVARAEKGSKSLSIKDLEKKRKSLQTKIDKLTDAKKDEDNIDFEQLGVDALFIDEAHNFKNLMYTTSMSNVAGLGNKDGAKRSFDLYTKVRYLQKLNGGRGIVFATATPVMNSMSEMYIMQRYLQPDVLEQQGLNTFDAWAKQFGEVVNGVEIKPSGQGYRVKQSFSRFKNLNELQMMFRSFADVLTEVPGLKIPKMKGGKVNVVECEPGEFQKDYMKRLEERAEQVKNVDPSVDNMLKITSDGRKVAYTQRMIEPGLPYEDTCKIVRCAENVANVYKDSKANKGTQLVFCDMATPKGKAKAAKETADDDAMDMESARLYDDIRAMLVKKGIPRKEIAFIHEADTDAKKKKLFADVNDGKVRVLIGSTAKMGVGMNAQKRIVAIHHLDAPWRPGDVEQRNGRAYRQGNINDEVECFTYVTVGSFDARLWDILDRKQSFINQIMNGENVGREVEDTGEVTLSAAEVKALASGSPLILEQVQLDTEIKKLESLQRAHRTSVANAAILRRKDMGKIAQLELSVSAGKIDVASIVDTYSEDKFSLTVGKKKYTDKKDAGVALMAAATKAATEGGYTSIGSFAGFDLRVMKTPEGIKGMLYGKQGYEFKTYPGNTTYMVGQLVNRVQELDSLVKSWENSLAETKADLAAQEKLMNTPFAKEAELDEKRSRYKEIMDILTPKDEQMLASDEEDAQYQERTYEDDTQHQQRTETLTDREVLQRAADLIDEGTLTEGERGALQIFRNRLTHLEDLQNQRAELTRLYRQQQFGKGTVDRDAADATRNRMSVMDEQIQKASEAVLDVEQKSVLKDVLKKARKIVEQQQRSHDKEIVERARARRTETAEQRKYRERIRKDVDELSKWVLHPSNKDVVKHVPDSIKSTVIPFITSIDFTSKRHLKGGEATKADKEFVKKLQKLEDVMKDNYDLEGLYSGYMDLPENFMDNLQKLVRTAQDIVGDSDGFIVNRMTSDELKVLAKVVRDLKMHIMNMNRFHVNAMYQHVYEAGGDSIDFMSELNDAGNTGAVSEFLLWQQMRPAYAFERFGNGGLAIYDGLRRGQAQLAFNTKAIIDFAEKAYTDSEVKAWEKETKTVELSSGKVQVPVSYLMSFYCLSKRPNALTHILGEGVRVATYINDDGNKVSDNGHMLTPKDVQKMIAQLTPRQKAVADKLQQFMAEQGGEWGNHVSLARFGEEMFGEKEYFPINSDGRHLKADADEKPSAASLYALLNMSFTKELKENANNRIILYSIFDVFSNHMASMAQYNAMALPVLDALKWFNYRKVTDAGEELSVREEMDRVFGVPEENKPGKGRQGYAQSFVINIIKAFNGTEAQGVPMDETGLKALRRYNMAQVAFNFRVIIQQPMAITRAAQLIDYSSIAKALTLNLDEIKQNVEEMQKHSGIALWKSFGFYDVNISRGLTDLIKHDTDWRDQVSEWGMWGAEKADLATWATIWNACKIEVQQKQKLRPSSKGYYEAVTKLFEDVVYKTQVVDSVMTKNEFLRSKGFFARAIGSFMSEPTTTASMLLDAYDKFAMDMQRGMSRQKAWSKNKDMIVRTAVVYSVGAVLLAAVQAVGDAWRDDDDYQTFLQKWWEAFTGNAFNELMPLNKLPILSDFYEVFKELLSLFGVDTYGNPPQSVFMQWYDALVKGTEILHDKITGADTNYTWFGGIYKLLQAASGFTGLPMATSLRELTGLHNNVLVPIWNNTVALMAPSLTMDKLKTYEPSEMAQVKYAYQDGWLTREEAVEQLLDQGLVDSEDEAYWTMEEWNDPDGEYSKYDKIYEAVRTNQSITEAMNELTEHGYSEKEVLSTVKSQIGKWYRNQEVSKTQAGEMLRKYCDMDSSEISKLVDKWSCEVVTGIAYDDIDEAFKDGDITYRRAVDMLMLYGGKSKTDAENTVTVYQWQNEGYDITVNQIGVVKDYEEFAKPAGITKKVYFDAYTHYSDTPADYDSAGDSIPYSKTKKVMPYIDSLPLTAEQKTALALCWWAESTVRTYKLW